MEYTIKEIAELAGVSTRALRYYDKIGLLVPERISSNGYRLYGEDEVDRLQHILFYKELDVPLETIKTLLTSKGFNREAALQDHLLALRAKKKRLDTLIATVEQTIAAAKGGTIMKDDKKFEGFKRNLVDKNEQDFGEEVRSRYGNTAIDQSNAKVMGLSEEAFARVEELSAQLNETLKAAYEQGDPTSELAQKASALHKEWLCYFWNTYSKEAHKGLAQMYVDDPRFTAYYDEIAPGCTPFLRDAIHHYCK